jgi:hypothetical protein
MTFFEKIDSDKSAPIVYSFKATSHEAHLFPSKNGIHEPSTIWSVQTKRPLRPQMIVPFYVLLASLLSIRSVGLCSETKFAEFI